MNHWLPCSETSTACHYDMKRGGGATCIPYLDKHMICIKSNEHDPLPSTSSGTIHTPSWLIKPT
jgi:hypothetical protein